MRSKPKRKRKSPRKLLIKKLDTIFSKFIRLRFAKEEMCTCVTCGKTDHYKKMQAGHFISRRHYSTRWEEANVQVQCYACNVMRYGEQFRFGLYLEKNYYIGIAEKLLEQSREISKYTDSYIEEQIEYYNEIVQELN